MRIRTRLAALAVMPALVLGTGVAAATAASAAPGMNLSFQTYGAATTGYLPHQSAVQDNLPSAGSAVVITVHHVSAALPAPENAPSFQWTTSPSALGPPRWVIDVTLGDSSGFIWNTSGTDNWTTQGDLPTASGSYAAVYATLTADGTRTPVVTGAFIVNDANGLGTWTFTQISYDGVSLLGNPSAS